MSSLNKSRYFRLRQPLIRLLREIVRLTRELSEFLTELSVKIKRVERIYEVRVAVCRYEVKTLRQMKIESFKPFITIEVTLRG